MFAKYKEGREEEVKLLNGDSSKLYKQHISAIDIHIKEREEAVGQNLFNNINERR